MTRSILTLVLVLALVAGLVVGALFGFGSVIAPVKDGVVLGLDLVGGVEITYEADVPEGMSADEISRNMSDAKTMIQQRLDNLGYTEASCYLSGDRRIVVEINKVEDPEKAVQQLGATAIVTFVDADGKVWLTPGHRLPLLE